MTTFTKIQKSQITALTIAQLNGGFELNGLTITNTTNNGYEFEIANQGTVVARVNINGRSYKNAKDGLWQIIKLLNVILNSSKKLINNKVFKDVLYI